MMALRTFLLASVMAGAPLAAQSGTLKLLFLFNGLSAGGNPNAGLARDLAGNLYGGTPSGGLLSVEGGTIFRLSPPPPGGTHWSETTLWRLRYQDGTRVYGTPIFDRTGALYDTTSSGPGSFFGTVFRLAPPAAGGSVWSLTTLYRFDIGLCGDQPLSGLAADASGALYGANSIGGENSQGEGFGTVYKLTPDALDQNAPWHCEALTYFGSQPNDGSSPNGPPLIGKDGTLYVTTPFGGTNRQGAVFAITPPASGKGYGERTAIWNFAPPDSTPFGGVIPGPDDALYGITSGYSLGDAGTIYRLLPPSTKAGAWREEVLHVFTGIDGAIFPSSGNLAPDGKGGFYGAAGSGGLYGQGTLYHIAPPAKPGGAWAFEKVYDFPYSITKPLPTQPNGSLLVDPVTGGVYGTAFDDYVHFGGDVFEYLP